MPTIINSKTCYPTVGTMSRSGTSVTLKFMAEKADAAAIYSYFVEGAFYATVGAAQTGYDTFTVNGWYQRDRSGVQMQEAWAEITLVFDTQNVQGLDLADGGEKYNPVYTLNSAVDERPIEQHPRFKCKWAYNLYELIPTGGTASAVPAWAATDNNPAGGTRSVPVVRTDYLWSRTPPASPDSAHEYIQVLAAEKFGVDSYLVVRPTVQSTIYYRTRQISNSDLSATGMLKAPAETYIYGNTATCWLVGPCEVTEATDELMAVTTTYTYAAEGWDTDIYDVYNPS